MDNYYTINFIWDEEAHVWVASSEEIKGFALEHDSFDILVERVKLALPDFIKEIGMPHENILLTYNTLKTERLVANG